MTWAITDTNKKVIAEKCAPGDNLADDVKLRTWKDHCQRVLNIEFPWGKNSINNTVAVDGPAIFVTEVLVTDAITKKQEKAGGPSGVRVENILARESDSYSYNWFCETDHTRREHFRGLEGLLFDKLL